MRTDLSSDAVMWGQNVPDETGSGVGRSHLGGMD